MSYTSIYYLILVIVTLFLYYVLPLRIRWLVLLIASGYFYYAIIDDLKVLVMFGASIIITYALGILIDRFNEEAKSSLSKAILIIGSVVVAIPLIIKRADVSLIVPVGLSFYTLQTISYMADINSGKIKPQKNILKYILFVSFFPIIIQGPISRYDQLSHRLYEGNKFSNENLMRGIQLVLWGLFLKFMIADKAAVFVNSVYEDYRIFSGVFIILAWFLYLIQLYADFMSCVVMSKGVGEMFGITIVDNFRRPLFAKSMSDLWSRWHISLSLWLRDYIYIPLGGSKKGILRKYINIVITFIISALWHGGEAKFLVWGIFIAVAIIIGQLTQKPRDKVLGMLALEDGTRRRRIFDSIVTVTIFTLILIPFRARNVADAIEMVRAAFGNFTIWEAFSNSLYDIGLSQSEFAVLFISILILFAISLGQEKGTCIRDVFNRQNIFVRWAVYLCVIWSVWIFGTYGIGFNSADFIYGGF